MIKDNGQGNRISVRSPNENKININVSGNNNVITIVNRALSGEINILCQGNDSVVTIDNTRRIDRLRITVKNGGTVHVGEDSTFEECYILADRAPVRIGRDFMGSFQTSVRTTDAHGIYDLTTGRLLNSPQGITVGDHVWIGQGAILAKGTRIGTNVVIAARSFVQKQVIPDNCIAGGTPTRVLRENTVWDRRMTPDLFASDADRDALLTRYVDLPDVRQEE